MALPSDPTQKEMLERELHDRLLLFVKSAAALPLKEVERAVSSAFERNYLIYKLKETNGRITKTAELCKVDKKTLIEKLKKHRLVREWYVS